MSLGLAFYIIMLLWFCFGILSYGGWAGHYGPLGSVVLLFLLFILLGWKVFGPPLHG